MTAYPHPGPRPSGDLPTDGCFHMIEAAFHKRESVSVRPVLAQVATKLSTRLYRVRPSEASDHPLLAAGEATAAQLVTVERIDGARMIFSAAWPWEDSDAWAGWRWRKAAADRVTSRQPGGLNQHTRSRQVGEPSTARRRPSGNEGGRA